MELPRALAPEDLPVIEAKMRELAAKGLSFERREMGMDAALATSVLNFEQARPWRETRARRAAKARSSRSPRRRRRSKGDVEVRVKVDSTGLYQLPFDLLAPVGYPPGVPVAQVSVHQLNSPENIEARRRIYQNLPQDPEKNLEGLSSDDRNAMKQVLNSLDRVAFLTQKDWIPEQIIMPWMHPMIAKSWEKLGPYVEYDRKRRNEPYFYRYAGELAERCWKWRIKNSIETKTNWVDHAL